MTMNPRVSIVIPTYNRARDLERALNSVLAQTCFDWEALIVDNHSSDNTDDIVRNLNDPRIKLFKIHNNGVIAASRNRGLRHARGEYVAFLDSDDWWAPRKLEMSLEYLRQGADVVYHDLFLATKPEQKLFWRKARTRELTSPIFNDLILHGNVLNNSSVLIRRKVLESINGLSEDRALIASEDFDAWLRAARITENFVKIPHTLGYYWVGNGNYWAGGREGATLERVIASLDYLESIYGGDIITLKSSAYWLNYVKGKAYFRMGSHAMAKKHLDLIRWRRAPLSICLKSQWFLLRSSLRHDSKAGV